MKKLLAILVFLVPAFASAERIETPVLGTDLMSTFDIVEVKGVEHIEFHLDNNDDSTTAFFRLMNAAKSGYAMTVNEDGDMVLAGSLVIEDTVTVEYNEGGGTLDFTGSGGGYTFDHWLTLKGPSGGALKLMMDDNGDDTIEFQVNVSDIGSNNGEATFQVMANGSLADWLTATGDGAGDVLTEITGDADVSGTFGTADIYNDTAGPLIIRSNYPSGGIHGSSVEIHLDDDNDGQFGYFRIFGGTGSPVTSQTIFEVAEWNGSIQKRMYGNSPVEKWYEVDSEASISFPVYDLTATTLGTLAGGFYGDVSISHLMNYAATPFIKADGTSPTQATVTLGHASADVVIDAKSGFGDITLDGNVEIGIATAGVPITGTGALECFYLDAALARCHTVGNCTDIVGNSGTYFAERSIQYTGAAASSADVAYWKTPLPENFSETAVTVRYFWSAITTPAADNEDLCMEIGAIALSDGDDLDSNPFAADVANRGDRAIGNTYSEISQIVAMGVSNTPTAGDLMIVGLRRNTNTGICTTDEDDDMSGNIHIRGIEICYVADNVFSGE